MLKLLLPFLSPRKLRILKKLPKPLGKRVAISAFDGLAPEADTVGDRGDSGLIVDIVA
jgi:hypothetical protein